MSDSLETKEEWRPVRGYDGYEVSDCGRVRSLDRFVDWKHIISKRILKRFRKGIIMKPWLGATGYYYVSFGRLKKSFLHRIMAQTFLGLDNDLDVDHIDGNPGNNHLSNLRICSTSQNLANQKKSKRNTSGYKGVCWDKERLKWMSQINLKKKHVCIGRFETKHEAALAYDQAAIKYFGEYARTNAMIAVE